MGICSQALLAPSKKESIEEEYKIRQEVWILEEREE